MSNLFNLAKILATLNRLPLHPPLLLDRQRYALHLGPAPRPAHRRSHPAHQSHRTRSPRPKDPPIPRRNIARQLSSPVAEAARSRSHRKTGSPGADFTISSSSPSRIICQPNPAACSRSSRMARSFRSPFPRSSIAKDITLSSRCDPHQPRSRPPALHRRKRPRRERAHAAVRLHRQPGSLSCAAKRSAPPAAPRHRGRGQNCL